MKKKPRKKPRVTLYEVLNWGRMELVHCKAYRRGDVYICDTPFMGRNTIKRKDAHLKPEKAIRAFINREQDLAGQYRREMDRHINACIKAQQLLEQTTNEQ